MKHGSRCGRKQPRGPGLGVFLIQIKTSRQGTSYKSTKTLTVCLKFRFPGSLVSKILLGNIPRGPASALAPILLHSRLQAAVLKKSLSVIPVHKQRLLVTLREVSVLTTAQDKVLPRLGPGHCALRTWHAGPLVTHTRGVSVLVAHTAHSALHSALHPQCDPWGLDPWGRPTPAGQGARQCPLCPLTPPHVPSNVTTPWRHLFHVW